MMKWIVRPLLFGAGFAIMLVLLAAFFHIWTTAVIQSTLKRCPDVKPEYQTSLPIGDTKANSLAHTSFRHRNLASQSVDILVIQSLHTP